MRTRNFRAQNEIVERRAATKSRQEKKPTWRGKCENAVSGKQLDSVRKETHVVSVMILGLETEAIRDNKDNRPLLHQKRRHRLTERYPEKVQAAEEKVLLEQEARFRADISLGKSARTRHVIWGTLPCVSISSVNQDANLEEHISSDMLRLMPSPAKS